MTTGASDSPSSTRPLRVAVVGAGPAGIYVADHLTSGRVAAAGAEPPQQGSILVDLFERLPVPFGLLRYGVAPDHVNIKGTGRAMGEVLARPEVRLFANVDVGADVSAAELRERYDLVVYTMGATEDRRLGIDGEDLPGSLSATSFVNWYNGHPEGDMPDLAGVTTVVVVGVGNVAIDVARILARQADELSPTDVPQDVLEALRASHVTDIHVLGRRGPEHAKFTTKELRELGELDRVDVLIEGVPVPDAAPEGAPNTIKRNLDILREWAGGQAGDAPRRLHLHFGARPVEIRGTDRVTGVVVEETTTDGQGTGVMTELPCQMVLRSVGYRGAAPAGVPFDPERFVIPTQEHAVVRDGSRSPDEYAAGWIKRGPSGVIGTNRSDAKDTVVTLLGELPALAGTADPGGVEPLLAEREVAYVDTAGWLAVLDAESRAGAEHGRGTVKISDWELLLQAAAETARS